MSEHKTLKDPDSDFSFGVRELRRANAAEKLSVNSAPLKAANEKAGFDPYNSGNFDRNRNWAKVGKR